MYLRLGFGTLLLIALVRLVLTFGLTHGIKTISADSKTAIKETSLVIKQNPSNYDAYTKRGDAYYALFKPKDAIQDYTTAISILPSAQLFNKRADAYTLDGNNELAEKDRAVAKRY